MSREQVVTSFGPALTKLGAACVWSLAEAGLSVAVYHDDDIPAWTKVRDELPMRNPDAQKPDHCIWHAQKFGIKPFVWRAAARSLEFGTLIWLDADTRMTNPVPKGFFTELMGDANVAYLGRKDMFPETGCVIFRVPEVMPLLNWCVTAYASGSYRRLDGWTDCHVLREGMRVLSVKAKDLTSHLYDGEWRSGIDAMGLSPLGPYITHYKGGAAKREALTCAL